MSETKMVKTEVIGEYRVALLEEDDVQFYRLRTTNPYKSNIERMEVEEMNRLVEFVLR